MNRLSTNRLLQPFVVAVIQGLERLTPLFDLAIRLWVANVFFKSGLTKIQSWDSTLALFAFEYEVPLLSPEVAAWMATATELSVPVLLALGLGARFGAVVLFVFNIIAAISYPEISPAGIKDHMIWGVMFLVTLFHGPGKISIDHYLCKYFCGGGHARHDRF